ncbi:MAG: hypothetical protein JXR84_27270 [Anaerolineae bacterium]|nr:hypothetical protein [Anaerolineae bacterium]
MDKIVERIERKAGIPDLVSILAEQFSPTDLQSLLLEVYRLRSSRLQPAAVLSDYESNRFVRPSSTSPHSLLRWEQIAFSHLPQQFEPIALSPVCPLGTNSVVAGVDQNWAVSTARNTEVVSDSTNVLALECALRRRELLRAAPKSSTPVHLAASHRLLRAQRYEGPGLLSHFSAFALCSAGRDQGNLQFELSALGVHIRFYLSALQVFLGPGVSLHLSVTDLTPNTHVDRIEVQLFSAIRTEFEDVDCAFDEQRTSGRGYYRDLCFHIHATTPSGQRSELVDGGCVDWTQQFLSNAKERLVTSGIGSERLCMEFSGEI